MKKSLLHTPEGVRDIYNAECSKKKVIVDRMRSVIDLYGYNGIETPTFEFFDIFDSEKGSVETKELFNNLSNLISDIIKSMNELNELNSNMTKNKDSVVSQMENIASVAEESAAAAEEVNASASEINDTMETIAKHTEKLDNIANELKVYVAQFKL